MSHLLSITLAHSSQSPRLCSFLLDNYHSRRRHPGWAPLVARSSFLLFFFGLSFLFFKWKTSLIMVQRREVGFLKTHLSKDIFIFTLLSSVWPIWSSGNKSFQKWTQVNTITPLTSSIQLTLPGSSHPGLAQLSSLPWELGVSSL